MRRFTTIQIEGSIEMVRTVYHVTPNGDAWRVQRERTKRAASIHENKVDAIAHAKALAKAAALGQVKVHGQDGKLKTEYTYGEDPRRTRG
jgi:hypothetical protein